jgi:ferredoxin
VKEHRLLISILSFVLVRCIFRKIGYVSESTTYVKSVTLRRLRMALKVTLDDEECIGCQSCIELCPDVFGFDDETEKAYVYEQYSEDEECIEDAAAACPVDCIDVEEE